MMKVDAFTVFLQLWASVVSTLGPLPQDVKDFVKSEITNCANRIVALMNLYLSGNGLSRNELAGVIEAERGHLQQALAVCKDIELATIEEVTSKALSIGIALGEGLLKLV